MPDSPMEGEATEEARKAGLECIGARAPEGEKEVGCKTLQDKAQELCIAGIEKMM